jgi:hypothetical protein
MAASSSHSYDDYDDFGLGGSCGCGGGSGSKTSNARVKKQVETRGGSQGSGTIYSSTKHVRLIEARKKTAGSSNAMAKKNPATTKKSDGGNLKR